MGKHEFDLGQTFCAQKGGDVQEKRPYKPTADYKNEMVCILDTY